MKPANKIIFNTGIIYFRLILGIIIGLFSTRIVLNALGEIDFGIYSLVAGVIGMLAFLNASMSGVSMRFIAISIGENNLTKTIRTFNSTLLIHFLIAALIALIMIFAGQFFFDGLLNIPTERVFAAKVLYYLMVITTIFTVISVPYDALISSHEDFTFLSLVELIQVLFNLFIALYIATLTVNQLITYGILIAVNQVLVRVLKQAYCKLKYKEVKVNVFKYSNKGHLKEILSFTGWKTLDSSAAILYGQIKGVLINVFFGVALNAANGIAKQVSGQIQNLSASLLKAINPQIIKSEGSGNRERMLELTSASAKFSFFLMSFFALPLIIEMPFVLNLWLKNVPEYSIIFCRLLLIDMVISKYTFPINTAITAVGRVKEITIVVLFNRILQFGFSYLFYLKGFPPESIYYIAIVFSIIAIVYKLYFGKKLAGLNIKKYFNNVFIKGSLPIIITLVFAVLPLLLIEQSLYRLFLTIIISSLLSLTFIYLIGLSLSEKTMLKNILWALKRKFLFNSKDDNYKKKPPFFK